MVTLANRNQPAMEIAHLSFFRFKFSEWYLRLSRLDKKNT